MQTAGSEGNLLGLSRDELEELAVRYRQPRYRGRQLFRALYARRQREYTSFTDLDRRFRDALAAHYTITYPEVRHEFVSRDGAIRYLLALSDGNTIETVFLPEENRVTLCLSSQVGCALGCRFCFTALLGVKRNLTAGEILGQVFVVSSTRQIPRGARVNLVFMGMGEPLLNLAQVMRAVKILADPQGAGIPLRRITLSTVGIVPGILALAREPARPKLAISLNASTEKQRAALIPVSKKYPLSELLRVCRAYPLRPRERLTFEYVLLEGINDSNADALRVAEMLEGMRAKVNLIPYNSGPELPYRSSPIDRVVAFQHVLTARRIPAFIRVSRGQDVRAACGQLSLGGVAAETSRAVAESSP